MTTESPDSSGKIISESDLDEVGKLMMLSACVFASAGKTISVEYLSRLKSHVKVMGWPDA